MPDSSPADPRGPQPSADLSTIRTTPPGKKRLAVTLAVLLSFILTLPILYKSTEIYRAPLPFGSITSLSDALRANPTALPCRFQVVFLRPFAVGPNVDSAADRLSRLITDEMHRLAGPKLSSCGGCATNFSVSISVDTDAGCGQNGEVGAEGCLWHCGSVGVALSDGKDDAVDELLWETLHKGGGECSKTNGGKVYTVVVATGISMDGGNARVVVGKHRHAWIVGEAGELDVVSKVARVFVEVFMRGGVVGWDAIQGKSEFVPVGSDGSTTLSFSLLNANPEDWIYDWDFHTGDEMLAPVLDALSPLANFRVESQVLYYTPKSSSSFWKEKLQSYIFSENDLPFFVNSKEWHLDTSIAASGRSKVLQFVVYVPPASECPLLLQLPNKDISATNGFISPMWGGVTVWNPPCSANSSNHLVNNVLSPQELHNLFKIFVGQIRLLFGLKSDYDTNESGIFNLLPSERGFTEWELDFLFRQHTHFNLLSCTDTLESLSNLVQSLPRMIVMEEIGKQVSLSLKAAGLAQKNADVGRYNDSSALSKQARVLAEDAFFHPSIMSISYSSAEHYFAIYMPFFAPVALHVLLATLKEIRRYKKERAKYMAYLTNHAKAS